MIAWTKHDLRERGRRRAFGQSGFTLIESAVALVVAGILLTGAWMGYSSMRTQWHVANAERMMDQYAQSAFQDLTNQLSWSWGAIEQSGGSFPRWKFVMNDVVGEAGSLARWRYYSYCEPGGIDIAPAVYLQVSCDRNRGVLLGGRVPPWAQSIGTYQWIGHNPGNFQTASFDNRDRMSVESLVLDWVRPTVGPNDPVSNLKNSRLMGVKMIMHYTFTDPNAGLGLFGRVTGTRYTRERIYQTKVYMRNWDVEFNVYKNNVLHLTDNTGSGSGT